MRIGGIEIGVLRGALRTAYPARARWSVPSNNIDLRRSTSGELDHFLATNFYESKEVTWCDEIIPRSDSVLDLRLRIYTPQRLNSESGTLYYIHGGGLIFNGVDTYDARCAYWAQQSNSTVVSVDYRLAPEHPFPAPLDDCIAGLRWVRDHISTGKYLCVVGDSAGGGLAAAVALRNRDEEIVDLSAQILIYPMLDHRNSIPISRLAGPLITWTYADNALGWDAYLGHTANSAQVSEYASPALAQDLSGLPPTYIETGTMDIFMNEDIDYAQRLIRAGVATEAHVWNGALHGFDYFAPDSRISVKAWRSRFNYIASISACLGTSTTL